MPPARPVEIELIADEAEALGVVAPVSVRLNPGIESGTHDYVATGHAGRGHLQRGPAWL